MPQTAPKKQSPIWRPERWHYIPDSASVPEPNERVAALRGGGDASLDASNGFESSVAAGCESDGVRPPIVGNPQTVVTSTAASNLFSIPAWPSAMSLQAVKNSPFERAICRVISFPREGGREGTTEHPKLANADYSMGKKNKRKRRRNRRRKAHLCPPRAQWDRRV